MTTLETTQLAPQTNARVQAVFADVLHALMEIIERHQVTEAEYRAAVGWLTEAGNQGYEIPLLMDVLFATTIDDREHAADGGTASNVEGPFYVADPVRLEKPYVLPRRPDEAGEVLVFSGSVRGVDGSPIAGATVDIWQANGTGEYSHFSAAPEGNLRGRLVTDDDGTFSVETVVPGGYEIPKNGATGKLFTALGRDFFRPGHIHFKVGAEGHRPLTTQLYIDGDEHLDDDVVGAVKDSLVISVARTGGGPASASYDFVLASA